MNSYKDLPDAPWIREAELYGDGDEWEDIYCPVCGAENPEEYYIQEGEVIGCDACIKCKNAWDWHCDHKQSA